MGIARVLTPYANAIFAKSGLIKKSGKDVITLTQDFINRRNVGSTNSEFMRLAYRLAKVQEDFNALTWQRIKEISQELETECSKEKLSTLSAELLEIANANIALNYSADASQTTSPSRQDSLNSQSINFPSLGTDAEMQTALDTSSFFDWTPNDADNQATYATPKKQK
jgi:hypothetical protein